MARIPDDELDRLRTFISIVRFVEAKGIALEPRGAGGELVGSCPWCGAEPSMVVTPRTNSWRCSGCGAGGDVIAWVIREHGVSFDRAVALLRADYEALLRTHPSQPVPLSSVRAAARAR